MKAFVSTLLAVLLPGCAGAINGETQRITIITDPPGTTCSRSVPYLDGSRLTRRWELLTSATPATVTVRRGTELDVRCERAGYRPAQIRVEQVTSAAATLDWLLFPAPMMMIGFASQTRPASYYAFRDPVRLTLEPASSIPSPGTSRPDS